MYTYIYIYSLVYIYVQYWKVYNASGTNRGILKRWGSSTWIFLYRDSPGSTWAHGSRLHGCTRLAAAKPLRGYCDFPTWQDHFGSLVELASLVQSKRQGVKRGKRGDTVTGVSRRNESCSRWRWMTFGECLWCAQSRSIMMSYVSCVIIIAFFPLLFWKLQYFGKTWWSPQRFATLSLCFVFCIAFEWKLTIWSAAPLNTHDSPCGRYFCRTMSCRLNVAIVGSILAGPRFTKVLMESFDIYFQT